MAADSALNKTPDSTDVTTGDPSATPQPRKLSSGNSVVSPAGPTAPGQSTESAGSACLPGEYLEEKLQDAERLLEYAAEVGIDVEDSVRNAVLNARRASAGGLSEQAAANLLSALTQLAVRTRPVTAASLRACADPQQTHLVIRGYRTVAFVLLGIIIPFSLAAFSSSEMSEAIRKDLDTANALAVKLSDELGPPQVNQTSVNVRGRASMLPHGVSEKDVIRDLQQFAASIRAVYARARQLNFFTAFTHADPFPGDRSDWAERKKIFELPEGLPDLSQAATQKIGVYQQVRYFAQSIQQGVSITFGAVATCVLPMLYALLGACAFLLRSFEEQIRTRTFTGADKHVARFLIAAIGGLVVGLFNNVNITQGATLPPLALAFLVGYAVDIFFSFLEGLLQAFKGARGSTGPQGPASSSKS